MTIANKKQVIKYFFNKQLQAWDFKLVKHTCKFYSYGKSNKKICLQCKEIKYA